ncbi:hypothetical protein Rmet_6560 [Cupriavidus metallidurans CH34]|uniref:Uncharacterized protein n=1 Tax=Cupriavidus metallidurans (strain ATCC 43123 / DSM 2839 / NBRC 102507 / CH34) TaxID=266264 RepID=D3DXZ6_CUPMC|nr:hypothetical protein Rmet_6560 [Cupriavidus metallidurans CH34]
MSKRTASGRSKNSAPSHNSTLSRNWTEVQAIEGVRIEKAVTSYQIIPGVTGIRSRNASSWRLFAPAKQSGLAPRLA